MLLLDSMLGCEAPMAQGPEGSKAWSKVNSCIQCRCESHARGPARKAQADGAGTYVLRKAQTHMWPI